MSAQYQHPIRTDIPLVITYPTSGPSEGYALLHAEGCSHTHRNQRREICTFEGDDYYYADDWFHVAPCARAPRGRKMKVNS